jgi:fructokinase
MKPRALIIGEALMDIVHRPHEAAVEIPGGSPMNVAIGLSRLGRKTALITWIGNDERGEVIRQHCMTSNVQLVAGSDLARHTSTAQAEIGPSGQASYEFDIEWEVPPLPESIRPHVVHTGSIAAMREPGCADVVDILKEAAESASISYDPNLRPSVMGEPSELEDKVLGLVRLSDVVKVSSEDIAWLCPGQELRAVAESWAGMGPSLVVVTKGSDGAFAVTSTGVYVEVANPDGPVVDTVGAGDSFMSGLIDALWRRKLLGAKHRADLTKISSEALRQVLDEASLVATVTVSRAGANPPWRDELPSDFYGAAEED